MHVIMNERRASRYFQQVGCQSVWTSSLLDAHQAARGLRTLSPPTSKTPRPLSPAPRAALLSYSGSLVIFAKLVKMMLIIWRTKRTLVQRSSWDPQGLARVFSREKKKQHAGGTRQIRTDLRQAALHLNNLFTLPKKSVTPIWWISSCNKTLRAIRVSQQYISILGMY